MSRRDLAFEHRVLKTIRTVSPRPGRVLLAISGGMDSMVMAEILFQWRRALKMELAIAHVHHGLSSSPKTRTYRLEARDFVKRWARRRGLEFYSNRITRSRGPESEGDLREWRESHLRKWMAEGGFQAVALAHHRDDLLETRLIRLIRGTGPQGLRSMCLLRREKFRPLL